MLNYDLALPTSKQSLTTLSTEISLRFQWNVWNNATCQMPKFQVHSKFLMLQLSKQPDKNI